MRHLVAVLALIPVLLTSAALPALAVPAPLTSSLAAAPLSSAPATRPATEGPSSKLSWSVHPGITVSFPKARSNFTYTLNPGASIKDVFVIKNLGVQPLTLSVYAADGITTASGHLDLKPAAEGPADVGAWFSTTTPKVTVAPGASIDVPFTLGVPKTAEPGDHVGGVASSYVSGTQQGTVKLDRRLAMRLNVRVAGEAKVDMQVSGVSVSSPVAWNPFAPVASTVSYTVTNKGNVRSFAPATVVVSGPAGLAARSADGTVDELIPGGTVRRTVQVSQVWPLFRGTAVVRLEPASVGGEPGVFVEASAGGWSLPWAQLVLVIAVVLASVLIARRRVRRPDLPPAEASG